MAITTPHTRTPTQPRRQPLRPDVGGAAVYDQESVTPTFQVDDLHCIVGARARDGPHLDSGSPFLPSRPSSPSPPPPPFSQRRPTDSHPRTLAGMQPAAAAARWRGSRTDPTVACHYLRLKIVWLVTVNFGEAFEGGCILIALSRCFSLFFLFSHSPESTRDEGNRACCIFDRAA